ncbi:hypothetical protein WR25_01110 isoform B [Diploscapter pachys]|uniref:Dolichyl-diphosphooligosaccharide--protein glycosyltransferase subunit STT3A n=1 Tax=Diploscapter pachys TaxID=2018661 RepID=A0A2A2LIZ4_9BILA|nr:hypothetical protein WR25_01110 isoform A [Diploscapter pachys]PAV86171.1 hypothetical protein WR25_01110 isoform B [Diploscapter pachys]
MGWITEPTTWNVIQLGLGFFCNFFAFNGQGFIEEAVVNSQSSHGKLNKHAGYYSLAIIYFTFTFGNFVAAPIVDILRPKFAMVAGILCYACFQVRILYGTFTASTFRMLITQEMLLLAVAFAYTGIEQSYWTGIYPTCISFTQQLGNHTNSYLALNSVASGLGQMIAGLIFGILGDYTRRIGREKIVLLGAIVHLACFVLSYMNFPSRASIEKTDSSGHLWTPNLPVTYAIGFLLGFGDACWNTQIYSLLCDAFSHKSSEAFALFKFWQSGLSSAAFFYSPYLELQWHLLILIIFSVFATASFVLFEKFLLKPYKRKVAPMQNKATQDWAKMLGSLQIGLEGQKAILKWTILSFACFAAFFSRLFAVIRYESVIHEFDPYFNYRTTRYLQEKGYYSFHNWFDDRAWYPLGRIVGGTIYPGLMATSTALHWLLHHLHFTVHIRDVCVFLAPLFSSLTVLATYLLTSELADTGAGLVAACFVAIVPGYTSRSVAGSYDNEGIAIFAMIFTYYFWIKAVKTGSIAYFYMVSSWGGYVFLINLMPIHILILIITGRFKHSHYVAWSTVYAIGTILSMQIPFVGFQPVQTSEHMGALGVFGLCQLIAFSRWLQSKLSSESFDLLFRSVITAIGAAMFLAIALASFFEKVAPWTGRFYSLLDPSYAKNHIPIIASVSEHQPTAWASYFFDLHMLVFTFPLGLYYVFSKLTDHSIFIIMYSVTSIYFSGVMVRLMLTLAPCMCILGGIGVSGILQTFVPNVDASSSSKEEAQAHGKSTTSGQAAGQAKKDKKQDSNYPFKSEFACAVVFIVIYMFISYAMHCTWVTSEAYSSPSIVLSARTRHGNIIFDDFREAYSWLRHNTKEDARVMSWWDYGYQLSAMANRTTLVDNATWNFTHISRVGQAMASNESHAYEILRELDVDYVLVIFGGLIGYFFFNLMIES